MKLLEYEAKSLLRQNDIPVPQGTLVGKTTSLETLPVPIVLKSQVPVGGRGKLGGVVVVESASSLTSAAATLFNLPIKGFTPNVLLAEEKLTIAHEYYLCFLIDRSEAAIRLMCHKSGGIEVESNREDEFYNTVVDDTTIRHISYDLATFLDLPAATLELFILALYAAFKQNDATLLEINPLVMTDLGMLVCGDCKMELDDAAGFRHDWRFKEMPSNTNFVMLNKKGTVATIANGAGLAMATVDAVAARGLTPANFLDIGGGATAESVVSAFKKIMEFPSIEAIVINIFAGITRCDEVAKAIITAKEQLPHLPPLFIRLAGTHFEEAVELLTQANIPTLATLDECLESAKEAVDA